MASGRQRLVSEAEDLDRGLGKNFEHCGKHERHTIEAIVVIHSLASSSGGSSLIYEHGTVRFRLDPTATSSSM